MEGGRGRRPLRRKTAQCGLLMPPSATARVAPPARVARVGWLRVYAGEPGVAQKLRQKHFKRSAAFFIFMIFASAGRSPRLQ